MYESKCSCEHEKIDEWANSRTAKSEDEQFRADVKFMSHIISGGLNGPKSDQTTLPHTKVKAEIVKEDISLTMKKLAGIK